MTGVRPTVLFVEDDETLREATVQALMLEGFEVSAHPDAQSALRGVTPDFAGVIVSDIRMPGMDGIAFFDHLRVLDPEMQVIFTTAHGDVAMAVEAMKNGAADFFTKPYSVSRLVHAIGRAHDRRALVLENRRLRDALREREHRRIGGSSQAAERLQRLIAEVARADVDLMISGPTGVGKNFVARLVHDLSPRRDRPFVTVDAGVLTHDDANLILFGRDPSVALSRSGLVERAQGGTLVLDEIESIPERAKAQLLSLIDTRRFLAIGAERPRSVDVRIIAISRSAGEGEGARPLDPALLHRLGGIAIALPELASRREDIPDLFREFVAAFEAELELETSDLGEAEWRHLLSHDWPGNIRELRTFARNFVTGLTRIAQGAPRGAEPQSLREMVARFERAVIEDALRDAKGQVDEVQQRLSLPRKTLYDRLTKYGLRPKDYRR
jgi:two-component system C4-dicarboxylate transport response regulator DctD